jgi:hypothetical protein
MKDNVDSVNWSSVSQGYDPSQVDKPQNPRGLEQTKSEQPRLSRSSSASSMDSTDESSSERDIRSLAEARQGLRDAAKAKMSFGRFKNAVLSKLPFVGKTTYGKIMDRAAAADAPGLSPADKRARLDTLKQDIQTWQARHPHATGAKKDAIDGLDAAVAQARAATGIESAKQIAASAIPAGLTWSGDRGTAEGAFPDLIEELPAAMVSSDNDIVEAGKPTVPLLFHRSFLQGGSELTLKDGDTSQRLGRASGLDPREGLSRLAGSDEAAYGLAHFLHQQAYQPMMQAEPLLLQNADGAPVLIAHTSSDEQVFEVEKVTEDDGSVSYVIDYAYTVGLKNLQGEEGMLVLDPVKSAITHQMQIVVRDEDLQALAAGADPGEDSDLAVTLKDGRSLPFEVTAPPSYEVSVVADWDRTRRQDS